MLVTEDRLDVYEALHFVPVIEAWVHVYTVLPVCLFLCDTFLEYLFWMGAAMDFLIQQPSSFSNIYHQASSFLTPTIICTVPFLFLLLVVLMLHSM